MASLFEDGPQSHDTCIHLQREFLGTLVKSWKNENGGLYQLLLWRTKSRCTIFRPGERGTFLRKLVERSCNVSKAVNLSPVVGRQAQEATDSLNIIWPTRGDFIVADSLRAQAILGLDSLERNGCVINTNQKVLHLQGVAIPLQGSRGKPQIALVKLGDTVQVPAFSELELYPPTP